VAFPKYRVTKNHFTKKMSINYSFTINNVVKKNVLENEGSAPLSNVIINAQYTSKAWSGDMQSDDLGYTNSYPYNYEISSSVNFDTSQLDESSFVPYDQITNQVVLDWIVDYENCGTIQNHRDVVSCIEQVREQIYHASNESVDVLPGDSFSESTEDVSWTPPVKQPKEESVIEEENPNEGITDPIEDTLDTPPDPEPVVETEPTSNGISGE
jgi:hypothetical protein